MRMGGGIMLIKKEEEKDRLDLQHHALRLTADGVLFLAPISEDVQNVLDVGCGTGIWTIEFAEDHPAARVLGTDLSPIQPNWVPPNCTFLIDDADKEWVFEQKFDYIHSRAMIAAFKDWSRFFEQCFACAFQTRVGLDMEACGNFEDKLRAAGFVDIHVKRFKWPIGTWPKDPKHKLLGSAFWWARKATEGEPTWMTKQSLVEENVILEMDDGLRSTSSSPRMQSQAHAPQGISETTTDSAVDLSKDDNSQFGGQHSSESNPIAGLTTIDPHETTMQVSATQKTAASKVDAPNCHPHKEASNNPSRSAVDDSETAGGPTL
ncbi:MAG: hypothetical protein Q9227_005494 [Pyrenula ochraceoflavens]